MSTFDQPDQHIDFRGEIDIIKRCNPNMHPIKLSDATEKR